MSQALIDIFAAGFREYMKAFRERDYERAFAAVAPDVEWHLLRSFPEAGSVIRGREALIRFFVEGESAMSDWVLEPLEFIDAGESCVVVHVRGHGHGRTTHIEGMLAFFQVHEVGSDGLIVRIREYERREDALEATGLSE